MHSLISHVFGSLINPSLVGDYKKKVFLFFKKYLQACSNSTCILNATTIQPDQF